MAILAFGALRALRGGILWLFVSFWAFRGVSFCSLRLFEPSGGYPSQLRASDRGPPPQVAKNGPFPQGPIQRIYQRRGRVDFPIFGLAGVKFLHFGFARLHFLSFWPSGPSFLPLGLHFGLWGVPFATSGLEGGYPLALCGLLGL